MVWQREALGLLNREVATSTVSRTMVLFHATGSVTKRTYPKDRASRKPCQLLILNSVIQSPGIFLQKKIEELLLVSSVNLFTKVVSLVKDSAFLREQYKYDVSCISCICVSVVFVDETGADRRNTMRKYGYSLRGRPAVNHSLLMVLERGYWLHFPSRRQNCQRYQ